MTYICNQCKRIFKLQIDYEKHNSGCEFFFKYQKMISEPILTSDFTTARVPRTVNELFLKLSARFEEQEKRMEMQDKKISSLQRELSGARQDIVKLKANSGVRCKRAIIDSLKTKHEPIHTYHEWVKMIEVKETHLKEVFAKNLTEGIVMCVFERIIHDNVSMIPMRSFTQKPTIIYIFSSISGKDNGWVIASSEDLEIMISNISRKILASFDEWNRKNTALVGDSEKERNNDMNRMTKMFDISTTRKKRSADFKKQFLERFTQDIASP